MKKKLRFILLVVLCFCLISGAAGCAALDDAINEIKGNLAGNGYIIRTYDNYGSKVMTTTGDKINIQGNPVKTTSYSSDGSVVTVDNPKPIHSTLYIIVEPVEKVKKRTMT